MPFVSGPTTKCCKCGSTALVLVHESFDDEAFVFVAEVHCSACGCQMLDSRRYNQPRPIYPINASQVAPGTTNDRPVDLPVAGFSERTKTMRLFDGDDRIGCFLDGVNLRLEKTKDGEVKVVDLTLRVQPFTPELAAALDPDVKVELFAMTDSRPRPKVKSVEFNLTVPKQRIQVSLLPEGGGGGIALFDVEISGVRARTEKGVEGWALIFYASLGPVGREALDYFVGWYCEQRFLAFDPQQETMRFDAKPEGEPDQAPRHRGKSNGKSDEASA